MFYLFIVAAIFGLDYKVKSYIEKNKKEGHSEKSLRGIIKIQRMSNYGAAGSILTKKPEVVKWMSGAALFSVGVGFLKQLFSKGNRGLKVCYSLILGGGLSNLYDRVKKGAVTDYFSFCVPIRWLRRLVFNISDMFIIFGGFIAMFLHIKKGK